MNNIIAFNISTFNNVFRQITAKVKFEKLFL